MNQNQYFLLLFILYLYLSLYLHSFYLAAFFEIYIL